MQKHYDNSVTDLRMSLATDTYLDKCNNDQLQDGKKQTGYRA